VAKSRKYVYIKVAKGVFIKARVFLRGAEEAGISASAEVGKDLILLKNLVRSTRGRYSVIKLEDLPSGIREQIEKQIPNLA